jgi:hypothetical protein
MFFGSIIVGVFAALWFWMGMRAADSGWAVACLGVPISALTMAATYWRVRGLPRAPAHERRRIGRVIGWASLFEGIAIFVAVNVVTAFPADGVSAGLAKLLLAGDRDGSRGDLPACHARGPRHAGPGNRHRRGLRALGILLAPAARRAIVANRPAAPQGHPGESLKTG